MKKYNVEISYNIVVEAKTKADAEEKALAEFDDINPLSDEMNTKITEIKDLLKADNFNDCNYPNFEEAV